MLAAFPIVRSTNLKGFRSPLSPDAWKTLHLTKSEFAIRLTLPKGLKACYDSVYQLLSVN